LSLSVPPWLGAFANGTLNRVLRLDPETLGRLGELEGKTIRIDLGQGESAFTLFVEPSAQGLRLRGESERPPDVTLRGSVPVFARLARTGIAAGELQISGDIELGSRFKRILEGIDLDWEEPLSRAVGDVAAHEIGRALRAAGRWSKDAARALAQDSAEYLQEEVRILVPRVRVEEFFSAVDDMRTRADRLQKRIDMLLGRVR
jgi:ubiquinone biosynthesis protein UbiJ